MYKRKKQRIRVKIIVGVVIVICLVISSVLVRKNFNLPSFFLKDGVLAIDSFFGNFFNSFNNKDYNDLLLENENLKKELEIYKIYENENEELENQILKLKEVTKVNSALSDSSYINGSVVNRDFDYWQEKLIIDIGANDGVSSNMAVVSDGGLVGITDDVSGSNSSVLLLCNKGFPINISVKIKIDSGYVYGILNNYDSGTNYFEVVGVVENVVIPAGSKVVTTGLGNIFPSGILVGYVTDVSTDNFDLSKVVNVKSSVDFNDISYVTVVKRDDK